MICNKCFIDKPETEFFVETKKNGKQYRKKYCNECFRQQAREWKKRNRNRLREINKNLIDLPIKEEIYQPDPSKSVSEIPAGFKECYECKEILSITRFYKSVNGGLFKRCKTCHNKNAKQKQDEAHKIKMRENGGSERVKTKPNEYMDVYQKAQTFWLMELIGWKYNDNGVWSKEGIKDKDKNWVNVKKKVKIEIPVEPKRKFNRFAEEMYELYKGGMIFKDIGVQFGCSKTTAMKVVREYEKR